MAFFLAKSLVRGCLLPRPQAVFSNMALPAGVAGALLALYWRVPHILWHHGSDVHAGKPEGAGSFQRSLLRAVWRKASHGFFVSESLKRMAATYGVIPPASVLPSFADPGYLEAATENRGAGSSGMNEKYFLFAGRFEPVKNPLLILEAVALAKQSGGDTRPIKMVGQGSLEALLREKSIEWGLQSRVSIEAPVSPAGMSELLRKSYALIVPSRAEGLCTTILEAAAFGVPTIGARTVGITDAIDSEKTGLLFQENQAQDLARAMNRLSRDETLRNYLGIAAAGKNTGLTPTQAADLFLTQMPYLATFPHKP